MKNLKVKDIKHHQVFKCGALKVVAIGDGKPDKKGWVQVCPDFKMHTFESRVLGSINVRVSELTRWAV